MHRSVGPLVPERGVAAQCVAFAQAEGLIVRFLMGDRIAVCPPRIISPDEVDALFDRMTRALNQVRGPGGDPGPGKPARRLSEARSLTPEGVFASATTARLSFSECCDAEAIP